MNPIRRRLLAWVIVAACAIVLPLSTARGEDLGPEMLVRHVSNEVLETVKSDTEMQQGNLSKVMALVDEKVMPAVDMARLTSLAMGRHWRAATPDQQSALQVEFKKLLVRSYAGALSLVDTRQTIEIRPLRAAEDAADVTVSTRIRGRGDPVPIDYRLYRGAGGWRIYDVSFLGIWLAENYRNSFSNEISATGIDGLIERLRAPQCGSQLTLGLS